MGKLFLVLVFCGITICFSPGCTPPMSFPCDSRDGNGHLLNPVKVETPLHVTNSNGTGLHEFDVVVQICDDYFGGAIELFVEADGVEYTSRRVDLFSEKSHTYRLSVNLTKFAKYSIYANLYKANGVRGVYTGTLTLDVTSGVTNELMNVIEICIDDNEFWRGDVDYDAIEKRDALFGSNNRDITVTVTYLKKSIDSDNFETIDTFHDWIT